MRLVIYFVLMWNLVTLGDLRIGIKVYWKGCRYRGLLQIRVEVSEECPNLELADELHNQLIVISGLYEKHYGIAASSILSCTAQAVF